MNPRTVRAESQGHLDSRFRFGWAGPALRTRYLLSIAGLLAVGLLIGFYSVVAAATHRAGSAREQARVAAERQVVCSAFSSTSSRDLCLVTIASHAPQNGIVQASFQRARASAPLRRSQLTAGL